MSSLKWQACLVCFEKVPIKHPSLEKHSLSIIIAVGILWKKWWVPLTFSNHTKPSSDNRGTCGTVFPTCHSSTKQIFKGYLIIFTVSLKSYLDITGIFFFVSSPLVCLSLSLVCVCVCVLLLCITLKKTTITNTV